MNQVLSMGFMSNVLNDEHKFRVFNVIDNSNGESLGVELDFSLPSMRVIRVVEYIIEGREPP